MSPEISEATCEERRATLERYFEQRIRYERELVEQRFTAQEHALDLKSSEVERRLEGLNHAHAIAEAERTRVLSREMFDSFKVDYDAFKLETAKQLSAISTRSVTWTAAIGIIITVLTIAIRFIPIGIK